MQAPFVVYPFGGGDVWTRCWSLVDAGAEARTAANRYSCPFFVAVDLAVFGLRSLAIVDPDHTAPQNGHAKRRPIWQHPEATK